MVCIKLIELPGGWESDGYIIETLNGRVLYINKNYLGIRIEKCNLINIINSIKGLKFRNIILNGQTLHKIKSIFDLTGYEIDICYDEYRDISKLNMVKDDVNIEINANGVISMTSFENYIVDNVISTLMGDV